MKKLTMCLWYAAEAEEAAEFYVSLFADSEILEVPRFGPDGPAPEGAAISVKFRLAGQEFLGLNGRRGPGFTEAASILVNCADQAEVDRLWARLTEGGAPGQCGWLTDRWGVSWQIVPDGLIDLLTDPDAGRSGRAMQAMLGMQKLNLAELRRAAAAA